MQQLANESSEDVIAFQERLKNDTEQSFVLLNNFHITTTTLGLGDYAQSLVVSEASKLWEQGAWVPGNANRRTTLAMDFRRRGSGTSRRYQNGLADLCKRLSNLCGSDFTNWDIDNVVRFACTRHGTAHANLAFLKTHPELLEAIGRAANLCAVAWDPSLEELRSSTKKVIEVYHSVIKKASEGGCTNVWNSRGYYTGWVLEIQGELSSAALRGEDE